MRVLHVLDAACARPTDYARRTQALLTALRAQGVQTVHLSAAAACDADSQDAWPHHAWHLYRTPAPRAPRWLPRSGPDLANSAALALRLRRIARLTRPDLIHVHAPSAHASAAWPVARLGRLPLVVDADRRAAAGSGIRPLERFACARADALAAPSIEMRAALRASGIHPRRIAILPPAADVMAAPGCGARPSDMDMLDAPLLAYAGDLDTPAGIGLLLAALHDLRRKRRTLRLLVAGGGAGIDAIETRIAAAGLNGYVRVTGLLAGRRTADVLARADIAVFPALAGSGTLMPSRHLLNAMAQGCAVVASDIPCHRDLLVHGHSGMLFAAGSRQALADVLAQLLDERYRLRPLGLAAARCIAATHNWTSAAAAYRRLYESVLADVRDGRRGC
jgi:glycosyltransferase involved in cell wall biosynthesis